MSQANVGLGVQDRFAYGAGGRGGLEPIDEHTTVKDGLGGSPKRGGYRGEESGAKDVAPSGVLASSGSTVNKGPSAPDSTASGRSTWKKGALIGQGAYGSVFLGMDQITGQLMAVKAVQVPKSGSQKISHQIEALEAEVELLQGLDHSNIVRYLHTERTGEALHIFLEYVPGGSIASLVTMFGSLPESVIKVYTRQILTGLEYLHRHGIIHRDIKGANILVDTSGLCKLADFGASKQIEELATLESGFKSVKGTPYWMAPEIIKQSGHGRQADIWSVACTVIEMATGRPPWSELGSQVAAMFQIASSKGPPAIPEHLSAECKDFLYLCFNRNWKDRPLAGQLLGHPFLAGVDPPRRLATHEAPISMAAAKTEADKSLEGGGHRDGAESWAPGIKAWRTPPKAASAAAGQPGLTKGVADAAGDEGADEDSRAGDGGDMSGPERRPSSSSKRAPAATGTGASAVVVSIEQGGLSPVAGSSSAEGLPSADTVAARTRTASADGQPSDNEEEQEDATAARLPRVALQGEGRRCASPNPNPVVAQTGRSTGPGKGGDAVAKSCVRGEAEGPTPRGPVPVKSRSSLSHGAGDGALAAAASPALQGKSLTLVRAASDSKSPVHARRASHAGPMELAHRAKSDGDVWRRAQPRGSVSPARQLATSARRQGEGSPPRRPRRAPEAGDEPTAPSAAAARPDATSTGPVPEQTAPVAKSQENALSTPHSSSGDKAGERTTTHPDAGRAETFVPGSGPSAQRPVDRALKSREPTHSTGGATDAAAGVGKGAKAPVRVSVSGASMARDRPRSRTGQGRPLGQSLPVLRVCGTAGSSELEEQRVLRLSEEQRVLSSRTAAGRTPRAGEAATLAVRSSSNPLFEHRHCEPRDEAATEPPSTPLSLASSLSRRGSRSKEETWVLHRVPASPSAQVWKARVSADGRRASAGESNFPACEPRDPDSNQSTYNPMEEPSWVPGATPGHMALLSKLAGMDQAPVSSLDGAQSLACRGSLATRAGDWAASQAAVVPQNRGGEAAESAVSPSKRKTVAADAGANAADDDPKDVDDVRAPSGFLGRQDSALGASWEIEAAVAAAALAHRQRAVSGAAEPDLLGSWCPPQDHIVWTNDDGDIDALPWDVGRSSLAMAPGTLLQGPSSTAP